MIRFILPSLTVLALFGVCLGASADDLKDAAARQKIAAEKLVAQVNDAIEQSRKQDPRDAAASLRQMLNQIADSQDLLPSQRSSLRDRVNARLRIVNEAARGKTVTQNQRPAYSDPDRPRFKPPISDPNSGASGTAKGFIDSAKGAQQTQADLIREREKGRLAVDRSIEKTGVLTDKDIAFPKYWKELSARRKEMVSQVLTAKEVALLKTLNSVMSPNYDGDKFKAVINHIQDRTGLTIIMDEASMQDARVDYDDPVTFKIPKVTVRTVLKKILGDKGLTYIIKEGAIQVMTPKKASEHTVLRSYPIDDLVSPSPQAMMMFGPFYSQFQMQQNAQQLINLIQMTVEPSYWQPNGPGSIQFFAPSKSLVIRASAEMHYQMASPGLFGAR